MIAFFLNTTLGRFIATAVAALMAVLLVFHAGQREARQKAKAKKLQEYQNTRKAVDDAETFSRADDAREWLRKRKP